MLLNAKKHSVPQSYTYHWNWSWDQGNERMLIGDFYEGDKKWFEDDNEDGGGVIPEIQDVDDTIPSPNDDLLLKKRAKLRCDTASHCAMCVTHGCGWCIDTGECVDIDDEHTSCPPVEPMDWKVNYRYITQPFECSSVRRTEAVEPASAFLCEAYLDSACPTVCRLCHYEEPEDSPLYYEVGEWFKSLFCSVYGVKDIDLVESNTWRVEVGGKSIPIDFEELMIALLDEMWTTQDLGSDFCGIFECCPSPEIKYRVIPMLTSCHTRIATDFVRFMTDRCIESVDDLRQKDSDATQDDPSMSRDLTYRILLQLQAMKLDGSLSYLSNGILQPDQWYGYPVFCAGTCPPGAEDQLTKNKVGYNSWMRGNYTDIIRPFQFSESENILLAVVCVLSVWGVTVCVYIVNKSIVQNIVKGVHRSNKNRAEDAKSDVGSSITDGSL